ncbi:MAG TPA: hypothetical protein VIL19_07405 [Casimicrobiaceae bacterium]
MADRRLVEDMAKQMFDCLRNGHLCLARGDTAGARSAVDEAHRMHKRLMTIAKAEAEPTSAGAIVLDVIGERIDGLAALVRQNRQT